jgi:hypothetical protein
MVRNVSPTVTPSRPCSSRRSIKGVLDRDIFPSLRKLLITAKGTMPLLTVMHVYFGSQARRLPISTAHSLMHHRCRLKYHDNWSCIRCRPRRRCSRCHRRPDEDAGLGSVRDATALVAAAVQKKMLALAASAMPLLSLRPPSRRRCWPWRRPRCHCSRCGRRYEEDAGLGSVRDATALVAAVVQKEVLASVASAMPLLSLRPPL